MPLNNIYTLERKVKVDIFVLHWTSECNQIQIAHTELRERLQNLHVIPIVL